MKVRYQYRLYPNRPQAAQLARQFGCCRVVWNDALALCRKAENLPKNSDLQKQCITQAKQTPERVWLAEVSNIPLQQSIADLGIAYKNFFDSLKGQRKGPKVRLPRFKRRSSRQSARFTRGGFSFKGSKLYLAKIGKVKVNWSRQLPSVPSSVTIVKEPSGRYFASFVIELEPTELPDVGSTVGVDLGITTFATLSTGEKVTAPKPLRANLKRLARLQRQVARCERGSNRQEIAKQKVARLHCRIRDIRTDFLHKLSSKLIFENQVVSLEDLNVSGMVRNRKLAKAISDLGWRQFRTMLEAKGLMYGREVRIIDRWEPTSQVCSTCGHRGGRKALHVRKWQCLSCGATHDRDINAAMNIKVAGGQSETQNGRRRADQTASAARPDDASTHLEHSQLELFSC